MEWGKITSIFQMPFANMGLLVITYNCFNLNMMICSCSSKLLWIHWFYRRKSWKNYQKFFLHSNNCLTSSFTSHSHRILQNIEICTGNCWQLCISLPAKLLTIFHQISHFGCLAESWENEVTCLWFRLTSNVISTALMRGDDHLLLILSEIVMF